MVSFRISVFVSAQNDLLLNNGASVTAELWDKSHFVMNDTFKSS